MGKVYTIKRMTEGLIAGGIKWDGVEKADIACFPWDTNGYRPVSEARVIYTEKGFYVYLISYEKEIRAVYEKMNDMVCKDSCLEFFINPNPENDGRYMNFELNPIGTLYLGIGQGRHDSSKITDVQPEIFKICTSVKKDTLKDYTGPYWSVQLFIPFDFIESRYGKLNFVSGMKMAGNFYKCGDDTKYPHFGCWNEITIKTPDFHMPKYFGTLVLE